ASAIPHLPKTKFSYQPTILSNATLLRRLSIEIPFLLTRVKRSWPAFNQDPLGFAKQVAAELLQGPTADHRPLATALATFIVGGALLFVLMTDGTKRARHQALNNADDSNVQMLAIAPPTAPTAADKGVGTGSLGRVGFDSGRGEGSNPEPKRAHGGGSGGNKQKLAVSDGSLPPPSQIPAPIPTAPIKKNPALPAAGIDIDPALWRQITAPVYGDPRSSATTPSNGIGEGGGIGTNSGQGIGDGDGDGFGPGTDGNIGGDKRARGGGKRGGGSGNDPNGLETILRASMVALRVRLLSKPEPQYSEEARRNQISGTVVLRAVFSKTGEVINIRAISPLPYGLTERAIAAARQIRFLPATKDDHPVSVHMQLEYNFNLY
ncbi:MAG: energy transducer TonB, partial [Pyrinomonadaceae bacterium]